MDLGTIQKKLWSGMYSHPGEFVADVRLVFDNCRTYNLEGTDVMAACATLADAFARGLENISPVRNGS